ncbi:MAG: hypothetical protein RBT41_04465 [Clostridia bacterium]|nr:hypothetical protein [Clostridia bacterium]
MVVAAKKAVGAEYGYRLPAYGPKKTTTVRVRVSRRNSGLFATFCGVALIAVLFFMGLSFTFLKAYEAKLHFDLTRMNKVNQEIFMQNEKLRIEIARLNSLDRIEALAIAQMGMIKAPKVEYLALQANPASKGLAAEANALAAAEEMVAQAGGTEDNAGNLSAGRKLLNTIAAVIKVKAPTDKG